MSDHELFTSLIEAAKKGDAIALDQLVKLYEPEVRLVARMRLSSVLRQHLDSVDLVQSVHKSILMGLSQARFDISSPDKLVALALTIVRRKAASHWRRHQRQKQMPTEGDSNRSLTDFFLQLESPTPAAEEVSERRDFLEQLFANLDPLETQLIEFRIQGRSTVEIAKRLELDPDVLRVKLSRLRKKLRQKGFQNDLL